MTDSTTTRIVSAKSLSQGDRIKFIDQETRIALLDQYEDWTILFFMDPIWDPHTETYLKQFGCHPGFCVEKIDPE